MKILSTLCLLLFLVPLFQHSFARQQSENLVKNGSFEIFAADVPDGWDTPNIPGTLSVVSATKICKSGSRAVKCEVKDFFGSVVTGYVCQKNIQMTGKVVRLSGAFNMHSVGKDEGLVTLTFQNITGSNLGTSEEYLDDSKGKFVDFLKEFDAPAGSVSIQLRITMLPEKSSQKAHPGTFLICDDVKLVAFTPKEKPAIQ